MKNMNKKTIGIIVAIIIAVIGAVFGGVFKDNSTNIDDGNEYASDIVDENYESDNCVYYETYSQEDYGSFEESDQYSTEYAAETTAKKQTTYVSTTKIQTTKSTTSSSGYVEESGKYYTKTDVSLYLNKFGHLPSNFMTKSEAKNIGWTGGNLSNIKYGYIIGGDKYSNYEGTLPKQSARQYYECDIVSPDASSRGANRIVYSNDGLIYYTSDHYETFTLLYGG